ncbi:MAG: hypothetical protein HZB26_13175 [Candidatus Hydrogenedentes bacterium]|nr:hypothetical protein [Candidatus Hydrogenedentota bacterium]
MSADSIDARLHGLVHRVAQVRRWLMLLIGLRTLAAGGAFALLYVLLFSALDHRLHLGPLGRALALALLAAGFLSVVYFLGRDAIRHYSARQAANYIERHHNYHQQLVTAIEYHEDRASYPYSKALAERVVAQIDETARNDDFTEAIPKWQVYLSAAVIAAAFLVVGIALYTNAAYFARYVGRLTQPLAAVAPLSATTLETLTGDLVTQPDVNVTLAAAIHGVVPEQGLLHLVHAGDQYGDTPPAFRDLSLKPAPGKDEQPQFASAVAFPPGTYQYQFVSGEITSDWHTVTAANLPELKGLKAEVKTRPDVQPYQQDLREFSLDVLEGAEVKLIADASEALSLAVVVSVAGDKTSIPLNGGTHFEHTFRADKPGMINFALTGASGLTQDKVPPLQLTLRADRPPEFKRVTPQGDYLATNVASIPIRVDVSDDFGLTSADLVFEIAGRAPLRIPATVERGSKAVTLAHTLELEEYDLKLNDTVIFYAEAADVPSGIKAEGEHAVSDMYLIEIKPYHQVWYQPPEGMQSDFGKQGLENMREAHAGLQATLEVARAILKKTWPLANKTELSADDRSKTAALMKDVKYNSEQIGKIKADPAYRFSPEQLEQLTAAQSAYGDAAKFLAADDPAKAVEPEKNAYQDIRKVLEELEKLIQSGSGSPPPQGPERVKLEEQVHLTRFEKEQTQWELKELANKLEQLRQEQKQLKERFERFLTAQTQQEGAKQATTDEKSWNDPNARRDKKNDPEAPKDGGGGESPSRTSLEGALSPAEASGGAGNATTAEASSSAASAQATQGAQGASKRASREDLLEVMRASERALQERAAELARSLGSVKQDQTPPEDLTKALDHLARALDEMKAADAALGDAYFGKSSDAMKRAAEALDSTQQELRMAAFMLEQAALISAQEQAAKQLHQQAEAAAEIARALEEANNPEQYAGDLAHLRDAWKQFGEQVGSSYVTGFNGGSPPNFTALSHGLVPTADKSNLQDWKDPEQIHAARWLATQYSSLAIEAERLRGKLRADQSSDVDFTNVEKEFFEKTAAFKPGNAL